MSPGAHASPSNRWLPAQLAKRWPAVATTAPWTLRSARVGLVPDAAAPSLRPCDPSIEGTSYRRSPLETSSDSLKNLDYPLVVVTRAAAAWRPLLSIPVSSSLRLQCKACVVGL